MLDSPHFFENEDLIKVVLRSKKEEQSFLNEVPRQQYWTSSGGPFFREFPEVDYQENMVIGILLGRRGIGNAKIQIDSMEGVSGKLVVHSTEILPFTHEDFVGYPAIMVRLERSNLAVKFMPIEYVEEGEQH